MDELLCHARGHTRHLAPGLAPGLARTGSSTARSHGGSLSTLDSASNEDQRSEESECCCGHEAVPTLRRIALAKQILDEATSSFAPSLSVSAAKTDKCKNTGALGPLLVMIQNEQDTVKLRSCLDTLAFLLLDKANRRVINEIHGLDAIMGLFTRSRDPTVLCSALDAVCSLVRSDDADKARVWSHPAKAGVLAMLNNPDLSTAHVCEVLCMIRKIAFTSPSGTHHHHNHHNHHSSDDGDAPDGHPHSKGHALMEPGLLRALAQMLQGSLLRPTLLRVLKVLKLCTGTYGPAHMASWHLVVFKLVPLLKDAALCEEVLHVLLQLSERPEPSWKNLFMAAGCIPPLLSLLLHADKSVPIAAVCVLSSLSDTGLSREQLSQEASLLSLLRSLQHNKHVEVSIGVLYTLNRLAASSPQVVRYLKQRGAGPLLRRLLLDWTDEDQVQGASQLLRTLGQPADSADGCVGCMGAGSPAATGGVTSMISSDLASCSSTDSTQHPQPEPQPSQQPLQAPSSPQGQQDAQSPQHRTGQQDHRATGMAGIGMGAGGQQRLPALGPRLHKGMAAGSKGMAAGSSMMMMV